MPAPTNTSFVTAYDLGSVPFSYAETADDGVVSYDLYFRFVAPETTNVTILVYGDDAVSFFFPTFTVWTGPAASPTQVTIIDGGNEVDQFGVQFPVTAGTEYFLRVLTDGTVPARVVLVGYVFAPSAITPGSILVPDDATGFPAAVVNPTTGDVSAFLRPFPPGESAFAMPGFVLTENVEAGVLDLFSWNGSTMSPITTISNGYVYTGAPRGFISGNKVDAFYFTKPSDERSLQD